MMHSYDAVSFSFSRGVGIALLLLFNKSLRFPKKVKLRREIARRGLTFTIAPDERYMTHAHRQNIVFDKFYNEVIYIMELAEMQQVEATRTSQYVIAIGGMLDFFEGAIVFKLSFLQKSQMYRGDVTAQDDKAYNWMSQMMQDRKAFVTFAKAWKQERSEYVLNHFIASLSAMKRWKANMKSIILKGKYVGRCITSKESIKAMTKRRYLKTQVYLI
eukprot:818082_1